MIININSEQHLNDVIENDRLVIAKISAPWCSPCKTLDVILEQIDNDEILIAKVNVDELPEIASIYEVFSVPTTIIFQNGSIVERLIGVWDVEQVEQYF